MKKLILFSFLFIIFASSCKKEDPLIPSNGVFQGEPSLSIYNEWLLIGGELHLENLETGETTVYNHFDNTNTVSSLRWDGPMFEIERIVIDSTTWSFYEPVGDYGEFRLNNDSINSYGLNITKYNISIIENPYSTQQQMGGSSKPIIIEDEDYGSGIIWLHVHEQYMSDNGMNYKYYSVLKFIKNS